MKQLSPIICKEYTLRFDKTLLMGILNVTPDSFSDGGLFIDADAAVQQGKKMVRDGADIIDVGGESTKPGSTPLSEKEELARILPVITRLVDEVSVPISVDTYKPFVAEECLKAGAHIVNDITGLIHSELRKVVWPSRRDAVNLTIIVIIISVVVGLVLGVVDYAFSHLIRVFLLGG